MQFEHLAKNYFAETRKVMSKASQTKTFPSRLRTTQIDILFNYHKEPIEYFLEHVTYHYHTQDTDTAKALVLASFPKNYHTLHKASLY